MGDVAAAFRVRPQAGVMLEPDDEARIALRALLHEHRSPDIR